MCIFGKLPEGMLQEIGSKIREKKHGIQGAKETPKEMGEGSRWTA